MPDSHSQNCAEAHPGCLCMTCRWDANCREAHAHFCEDEPPGECKKSKCKNYEQEDESC